MVVLISVKIKKCIKSFCKCKIFALVLYKNRQGYFFFFMININFACLIRDRGRVFQHCCISNILHKIPLW